MSKSSCGRATNVVKHFVITSRLFSLTQPPRPYMHIVGTQPSTMSRRRLRKSTPGTISGTISTGLFAHTVNHTQSFDEDSLSSSFRIDMPLLYPDANFKVWKTSFLVFLLLKVEAMVPHLALSSLGVPLNPTA
jgi:hypothetical protein